MILDLFSGGGGGWCLAARKLGFPSVGIEWDGPACGTRAVVGLPTIRADVSQYPPEPFIGKVEGICGGPPCQSFSAAGKRKGLADPRGQLVHEPMRWVRIIRPRWVALEQVPEVLGYWRWISRELREFGYSTWTGVLNAADYGVPQVRNRAILLASLDRKVAPLLPTHSETGHDEMFGPARKRWITMAEALGWGLTERPAYVVAGGMHDGGHHDGGSGQRRMYRKAQLEGHWKPRSNQRPWGSPDYYARSVDEPAQAISTNGDAYKWVWERPATTVMGDSRVFPPGGHHPESGDAKSWSSQAIPVETWELGVLQGFPADHPWQPPYVSAQIGNAIPPPLAEACLRAVAA